MATCVPWELDSGCCEEWGSLAADVRERSEELAWNTMRLLSAGRVGACATLMRPCLQPPCDYCTSRWVEAQIVNGRWVNTFCGQRQCSCGTLCEIVFPGAVAAIIAVTVDGETLDADTYRVDNTNRLVRVDGWCWPSCQDLSAPLGDVGTVGIEYVPGIIPDGSGLWAAGVLACEFAKACSGSKCRLPSSVTTIARQGVTFTMTATMFENGMTGIREVDAYLAAVNPSGQMVPPMVWSPDVPWARHRYETPTVTVTP